MRVVGNLCIEEHIGDISYFFETVPRRATEATMKLSVTTIANERVS